MTTPKAQQPKNLLDIIRPQLQQHKVAQKYCDLAEVYFHDLPLSEFDMLKGYDFVSHIQDVYDFFAQKDMNAPKIRVFNPTYSRHTVVEVLTTDQPFLLDTIWVELAERGFEIHHSFHPIICNTRDAQGKLQAMSLCPIDPEQRKDEPADSLIHVEFDRQDDADLPEIEASLRSAVSDAHRAVNDFPQMQALMKNLYRQIEHATQESFNAQQVEDVAFLRWLLNNNFIFLGYRHYSISHTGKDVFMQVDVDSGLGILDKNHISSVSERTNVSDLPPNIAHYIADPRFLIITKALSKSRVHRRADLDYIGIKEFDANGTMIGEHRFMGLFTSQAYNTQSSQIPIIGQKITEVLKREKDKGMRGYSIKALNHILETYPKDEVFQMSVNDLQRISTGILHLQERQRVKLFVRRNSHEQTVTALVFLPRERVSRHTREQISAILMEAYSGYDVEFNLSMNDFPLAQMFFKIRRQPEATDLPDDTQVEKLIVAAAVSWHDDLRHDLVNELGENKGLKSYRKYAQSFRSGYRENTPTHETVKDIRAIESISASHPFIARIAPATEGMLRLNLYHPDRINLSSIMPLFTNMGLNVEDENATHVDISAEQKVWLHSFNIAVGLQQNMDDPSVINTMEKAIQLAWENKLENCRLNGLIAKASLSIAQVIFLRALVVYMQQIGLKYGPGYVRETLLKHPVLAQKIAQLFEARFDPALNRKASEKQQEQLCTEIEEALSAVTVLDEDIILRRLMGTIKAMVRTNAWQRADVTDPLAFKVRSTNVPDLMKPHPLFEIFVYHNSVEGIHLRGGMVARGGLRWSDRPADFRTEVLGLMKTQMTKNAVIVPVGSKGGFVVKNMPCDPKTGTCDRATMMATVKDRYQIFISCLLSVTDNVNSAGAIVPPRNVVRWDEDDAYLVVAADKGTATFSDTANNIAETADYWDGINSGFWLGDAFASGGSNGYDHKKMGITAKGAWESVKHHFRALGKNIQQEDFTVVGIGDMGGDVFGNGMLLSKHIQLQVAFNHMHIFVDPTPDAAASFKERQRLFTTPGTTWADYDSKLISAGGGVFSRSEKEIKLSAEMKTMLGVKREKMTPNELIQAALKMDVELLWNGGIGTFIKGKNESHDDVGDRANNDIRINGEQLNAKVVGEGGNLGFTQQARIEYALKGGMINTDAIDNSAGVDCSDHEVNIKILLRLAEQHKGLNTEQRNKLLEEMTDNVAKLTLYDNYLQAQVISMKESAGLRATDSDLRLQNYLERSGLLDAAIEGLPNAETLEERRKHGKGYTRPELAILLSYTKMDLFNALIKTDLPDAPILAPYLEQYFPTALQERYADLFEQHQLKREIITTAVANELINRMGLTFLSRMRDETGFDDASITRAFIIAKNLVRAEDWWHEIEALDNKISSSTQMGMLKVVKNLVEYMVFWLLRHEEKPLHMRNALDRYQPVFDTVLCHLDSHLTPVLRKGVTERTEAWIAGGLNKATAQRLSIYQLGTCAPDISMIAEGCKAKVLEAMDVYFNLGEGLRLDYLHGVVRKIPVQNNWERRATLAIIEDMLQAQKNIIIQAFAMAEKNTADTKAVINHWQEAKTNNLAQYTLMLDELANAPAPSHAMLSVITGQLKGLI